MSFFRPFLRSLSGSGGLASEPTSFAPFTLGDTYAPLGGELCSIPTYPDAATNGNQAGHPSVVYIPEGVSGYKYWMAHTPLKPSASDWENPCIVASHDGILWETPSGVTNPLVPKPITGFNADTNLTWDGSQFILIFTEFRTDYTVKYMTSADGITWSTPAAVMVNVSATKRTASPSLRKLPDGTYQIWAVNDVPNPNTVSVYTAADLEGPWTETPCTFSHVVAQMWHLEVHYYRNKYIMLMDSDDGFYRHNLLFLTSDDGIAWTLDPKFPYAVCWNGNAGITASYYKSACVFGNYFGDGNVGRIWHTTSDWMQTRVTDIAFDSVLSISETYVADSPLTTSAPYIIGDNFTRANGDLTGTLANSEQEWLVAAAAKIQIDTNKIKMGAANSYAAIDTGVSDGMIGIRLSTFPRAAAWELEARSKRAGTGSNIKRVGLYFASNTFTLRVYNGTTTVNYAGFVPVVLGDGNMDGAEITMEFRGRAVTVRYNGRVMIQTTLSETDAASLIGNTQASLYMGDAATRIDRFFVQS